MIKDDHDDDDDPPDLLLGEKLNRTFTLTWQSSWKMFNERKHLHSPENRLKNVKRRKHLHSQVKLLNFPAHEPAAWLCVLWWRWQSLRCRWTCDLHCQCGVHYHHLWSTLASALHVLLKNQLSQPLARLLPRQEGFHLFLVNISIPCEIFTLINIYSKKIFTRISRTVSFNLVGAQAIGLPLLPHSPWRWLLRYWWW